MSDQALGGAQGGRHVGWVFSVHGSRARVALPEPTVGAEDQSQRATVGKLLAIRGRGVTLIGMITEVSVDPETERGGAKAHALAQLDLMGEILTSEGASRFRRGVRDYPAIGDPVEMIGHEELNLIFATGGQRSIRIGQITEAESTPAYVDVDQMLSKHFAIVGSTGVGKSSATTKILNEMTESRKDLRVLMLDVHNEYTQAFGARATAIGAQNLHLPYWLFNFEEITDVIYGGKPAAPEEVEILQELIPVAKGLYASQSSAEGPTIEKRRPRHNGFTADTPSPYQIGDLIQLIDERMGKLENRSSRMNHNRLMMRVDAIRNDPRHQFMFKNAIAGGDTMAQVIGQLFGLETAERQITVLQLASLPDEVVDAVVCVVSRLAFDFALWSDGALPLLLICEEAHRYASSDHHSGFAPARRALKRIAREGRKYGVHLGLVSQRPAEIDPTIVSQCGTFFVMRMTNDNDQALLRSAVSEAAANLLSFVPSLGEREVVAMGEGLPLPTRFIVDTVPQEGLPCSDMGSRGEKQAPGSYQEIVQTAIQRWRNATTSDVRRDRDLAGRPPVARRRVEAPQQNTLAMGLRSLSDGGAAGVSSGTSPLEGGTGGNGYVPLRR
ncbi:ATP-binding protein [Amaricoccus macauensis]|uniref:ATP-binding protein n=1 Tax=Amaricoccus macauensis TaxID=57001 RepID=UPI003C7B862F